MKIEEEGNRINFHQICPSKNSLFDDVGNPKYDVNFNIDYDFNNDTHTILKVENMDKNGSMIGKYYVVHEEEMIL